MKTSRLPLLVSLLTFVKPTVVKGTRDPIKVLLSQVMQESNYSLDNKSICTPAQAQQFAIMERGGTFLILHWLLKYTRGTCILLLACFFL